MIKRVLLVLPVLITLLFLVIGCGTNPSSPSLDNPLEETPGKSPATINHSLLGYYGLAIDTSVPEINVFPLRSQDLHLNITNIINATMGLGIAIVPGETNLATGLIVFDMTFTHPFPLNPEFSAFDMKGIMITPGSMAVGDLVLADYDETRVLNADGYSRWWNPTEFTTPGIFGYSDGLIATGTPLELSATVNPYKLFADVLLAEDTLSPVSSEPVDSPNGRAIFNAGVSNTRRYEMQFEMNPDIQLIFGYAIDACWDVPDPNPPSSIPSDFPIAANSNEAFRIAMGEVENTLYYDNDAGSGGGNLILNINIQDWQGIFNGNMQDEISSVTLMSPDLLAVDVAPVFLSDSGTVAFYTADLTGLAIPTRAGINQIICEVVSSDGTTYKQAVPPAPDVPVAAYQVYTVDVPVLNCETDADNDWLDASEIEFGDLVNDMVCLPSDYRDFYYFEIPSESVLESGQATLICDADQTKIGLYDGSHNLMAESEISGGTASIDLGTLSVDPGTYYIRVYTWNSGAFGLYSLELTGSLIDTTPLNVMDITPPGLYLYPYYLWLENDVFYALGQGLWTYDLSDPLSPQVIYGITDSEYYYNMAADFNYPYCYYITVDISVPPPMYNLNLIDFSDPAAPVRTKSILSIPKDVTNICINSTHIYISTDSFPDSNILIYDYSSDPLNPAFVGEYTLTTPPHILALLDPEGPDTMLAVGTDTVLQILGVEDPGAITDEGAAPVGVGWVLNDIETITPNMYVTGYNSGTLTGSLTIMTQTGGGPVYASGDNLPGTSDYLALNYPYAYVSEGSGGLAVCDITDSLPLTYLGSFPSLDHAYRLAVEDENLALTLSDGPVELFDLTIPDVPASYGTIPSLMNPGKDIIFDGNYIYIGDPFPEFAIDVIDISDPDNPQLVAENPVPHGPYMMAKDGDIIVTAFNSDIGILDASDPLNILPLATHVAPSNIISIGLKGDSMYFAHNTAGCKISTWDISDPVTPFPYPDQSYSCCGMFPFKIYGDILYNIADHGVRLNSIAAGGTPVYLGTYETPEMPEEVIVQNQYMYLNMPLTGMLEIVDISDILAPVHVSTIISSYPPIQDLAVDGQYAYLGGDVFDLISAIQVSPAESPSEYGVAYDDPFPTNRLFAHDGYLYETVSFMGIRIFRLY